MSKDSEIKTGIYRSVVCPVSQPKETKQPGKSTYNTPDLDMTQMQLIQYTLL